MGACLSCFGLRPSSNDDAADRQRLLYDDYQPTTVGYGTWGNHAIPPENIMSPEEIQRERSEFNRITQHASDQIVEIFPHAHHNARNIASPPPQINGQSDHSIRSGMNGLGLQHENQGQSYHDILLSMIPGDKSKRSIRIYPASRPSSSSRDAPSVRSNGSNSRLNANGKEKERAAGVFAKLNVDFS
jgi:Late endosomal/lysosomal adaptor and MAPK and MTOR activator